MPNICEYTVKLDEDAVVYGDCVGSMQRLVKLYRTSEAAQSDAGKYRTVILGSPFGSTLLWSNVKRDVPRINLSYRDGQSCAFPTNGDRCILPLAMLLVLGSNAVSALSVRFFGDTPSDEVMTAAAQLARQVCPGITCPAWFPRRFLGGAYGGPINVPEYLDFRA